MKYIIKTESIHRYCTLFSNPFIDKHVFVLFMQLAILNKGRTEITSNNFIIILLFIVSHKYFIYDLYFNSASYLGEGGATLA